MALLSSVSALDLRLGADGLSAPGLDASFELLLPRAPGWAKAYVAPTTNTFAELPKGVLPYALREKTGHSWTYAMGEGRLAARPTASGAVVVSNRVVFSAAHTLQTACFRLRLPRRLFKNGAWRLGERSGTWPTVTTATVREASFTLPAADEELTFRFDEPVQVRFQDDE